MKLSREFSEEEIKWLRNISLESEIPPWDLAPPTELPHPTLV